MTETKWERERLGWVQALANDELLAVIAAVNADSHLDENEGDRTERRDAVEWLVSRGARGYDWGIPAAHGETLGLRPSEEEG